MNVILLLRLCSSGRDFKSFAFCMLVPLTPLRLMKLGIYIVFNLKLHKGYFLSRYRASAAAGFTELRMKPGSGSRRGEDSSRNNNQTGLQVRISELQRRSRRLAIRKGSSSSGCKIMMVVFKSLFVNYLAL